MMTWGLSFIRDSNALVCNLFQPRRTVYQNTMMSNTTNNIKADRRARADRSIPYEEMRRLMQTYGSIKCLRKRQNPAGEKTKINSIKRKFYRWFPDLEERFVKDKDGHYQPKIGHELEMRYREEMRTTDGESLSKKRAKCRKENLERHGNTYVKAKSAKRNFPSPPSTITKRARISRTVSSDLSPDEALSALSFPHQGTNIVGTDVTLNLGNDPISSVAMAADTEPMDRSFSAEKGIFDDVEESFYGPDEPVTKRLSSPISFCSSSSDESGLMDLNTSWDGSSSSSSFEEPALDSVTLWDRASPSIEEMFNRSMEECCEEILGSSDDSESVPDYILENI